MANIFEYMERITGLSEDKQREIYEEVRKNHNTLAACDFHDFSIEVPQQRGLPKYQCSRCKGIVNANDKHWYELGIQHAKEVWD